MPEDPNKFLFFCCVSDEPGRQFAIRVPKDATVDDLKKEITTEKDIGVDATKCHILDLWKVSIADEDLDSSHELIRHPEKIEGSAKLRSLARLNGVFPDPPADEHLHIIVQRPGE
jgi:hypothetical protein